jgi:LPS export ABC transporter protein LptC
MVDLTFDKESSYTVKSTDVIMFVSDSGVTRFKATAKEWYMFEDATEPYWYFPEKVHGEQFDSLFNVSAYFDADTAYYYNNKQLWKLISNVVAVNREGQQFETSLLFWDQKEEKIYSDQFIRITQGEFINTGVGFEANQTLTRYRIFNPQAVIPVKETDSTAVDRNAVDTTVTVVTSTSSVSNVIVSRDSISNTPPE